MAPDTTVASESVADRAEVMASVDTDGSSRRLVIADVSRDEAWISMTVSGTVRVPEWD